MAAARGAAAALLLPALAAAQQDAPTTMVVIGYTSFEEPATVVGLQANVAVGPYYDRRSGATDHELRNEGGQNPVAYAACSSAGGRELGFRTFYVRTREEDDSFSSAPGMMDGARIGVIGDTTTDMHGDNGQGGPAPDGSQYFALEDTDGFVYVEMDPVAVGDYSGLMMSGWVKIEATSWEEDDRVRIWAELADPARGYRHPQPNLPSLRSLPALHNGTWAPFRMLGEEEEEAHHLEAYVEAEALSAPFWD